MLNVTHSTWAGWESEEVILSKSYNGQLCMYICTYYKCSKCHLKLVWSRLYEPCYRYMSTRLSGTWFTMICAEAEWIKSTTKIIFYVLSTSPLQYLKKRHLDASHFKDRNKHFKLFFWKPYGKQSVIWKVLRIIGAIYKDAELLVLHNGNASQLLT